MGSSTTYSRTTALLGLLALASAIAGELTLAEKETNASAVPPLGLIEFYGFRKVPRAKAQAALGLRAGDPTPHDPRVRQELERKLARIPGVANARLNCVCCADGKTILYVGIQENGVAQPSFRAPPTKPLVLPKEAMDLSRQFDLALQEAVRTGDAGDDLSEGHSLAANAKMRAIQQEVIAFAPTHVDTLRSVLRESSSAEQRSIAAWMLGYAPDKRHVVADLLYAIEDPNEGVRNDATRALGAIAVLAARRPSAGIEIPPQRFIEMLDSLDWSDRNKALLVLQSLTASRPAEVMRPLIEKALPALVEMARWHAHGFPAFQILARLAGLEEKNIVPAWVQGDREAIIAKAAALD